MSAFFLTRCFGCINGGFATLALGCGRLRSFGDVWKGGCFSGNSIVHSLICGQLRLLDYCFVCVKVFLIFTRYCVLLSRIRGFLVFGGFRIAWRLMPGSYFWVFGSYFWVLFYVLVDTPNLSF